MSRSETALARHVFADHFVGITHEVGDYLLVNGPKSLVMIAKDIKIKLSLVQKALKLLMQHHFVTYHSMEPHITFKFSNEGILQFLRNPAYLELINKKLGRDAFILTDRIMKSGELPISKLLFICGIIILEAKPEYSDDLLLQQLNSFYLAVKLLAEYRFIMQSINYGYEGATLSSSTAAENDISNPKSEANPALFVVPKVDLQELMVQIKKMENGKLDNFPDSEINFKINYRKFMEAMRNQIVLSSLERKYKPLVDKQIFEVIIDLGFAKYPWEKESIPVGVNEVADVLRKALGDTHLNKYIFEYFEILEDDPLRIFTKLGSNFGGQFILSMQKAFTHIMWNTIEKIVTDRHGYHAARIFRLVKENNFIEQERIQELAMIPAKEAKHLTYKLVGDRFVFVKEVRKTYSVGGVPGKVVYLFHVDLNQAVLALMEATYKGMVNLKLRQTNECMNNSQLLQKEDRINRILAKMESQQCTEEQLKEIQELITPPQRAVLGTHKTRINTLMAGLLNLDDTVFIIQMYLLYNQRKPPPKAGRGRARQNVEEAN